MSQVSRKSKIKERTKETVRRSYLGNRMLLYKSITVSKTIAKAEHKCPSEWPLIVYPFTLYILLSASPSILETAWAAAFTTNHISEESGFSNSKVFFLSNKPVAKSQNLEWVYLGGNKTVITGITRQGINWNVRHNRRSLNTLPSTKTHIITSIWTCLKIMKLYV